MTMGSIEADIAEAISASEIGKHINIEEARKIQKDYLAKLHTRINEYNITVLNNPRPGKKLLVLDVDYTLYDHKSSAETAVEVIRPYLHEFLTSAYEDYDIVIWSTKIMECTEKLMNFLGIETNPNYKIMFYLDSNALILLDLPKFGVLINVKSLELIWSKFDQYTMKNTIMFDAVHRNFFMHPKNGLKVRPFRKACSDVVQDQELVFLAKYLKDLAANCSDFTTVNHRYWEKHIKRKNLL